MPLPGPTIIDRDSPTARTPPTAADPWFAVGLADRGPADAPTLITSLAGFELVYGDRVTYSVLYDAIETYFREGGSRAYVARVVGPAAVKAFKVLQDGAAANTLRVTAKSPGDWANGTASGGLAVQVSAGTAGGTFVLTIKNGTAGTTLEQSGDLADATAAIAWSEQSLYVDVTDEAASALDPAVAAAAALATGTDDRASIVDAQWLAALNLFTADLGPGQVSAPGRTTTAGNTQILQHAKTNNRVAILDGADTASASTLTAEAAALQALTGDIDRWGGLFAPWAKIPGLVAGTTRTVPYSAVQAGLEARKDGDGISVGQPAAGTPHGDARFAIDVTQTWTDADRETLNDGSVNVARSMYGGVRTYGNRAVADADDDPLHKDFAGARVKMAITAQAGAVAERFVFAQIDGRGHKIGEFGGQLEALLIDFYIDGALYGDTPEEAFRVDVGETVNTPVTIAAQELHAVLEVKTSPAAERVIIEIVRTPTTQEL